MATESTCPLQSHLATDSHLLCLSLTWSLSLPVHFSLTWPLIVVLESHLVNESHLTTESTCPLQSHLITDSHLLCLSLTWSMSLAWPLSLPVHLSLTWSLILTCCVWVSPAQWVSPDHWVYLSTLVSLGHWFSPVVLESHLVNESRLTTESTCPLQSHLVTDSHLLCLSFTWSLWQLVADRAAVVWKHLLQWQQSPSELRRPMCESSTFAVHKPRSNTPHKRHQSITYQQLLSTLHICDVRKSFDEIINIRIRERTVQINVISGQNKWASKKTKTRWLEHGQTSDCWVWSLDLEFIFCFTRTRIKSCFFSCNVTTRTSLSGHVSQQQTGRSAEAPIETFGLQKNFQQPCNGLVL